jgi:serine protease inhibitor
MKNKIKAAAAIFILPVALLSCSKNEDNLPTKPVPIDLTQNQGTLIESGNSFAFDIFRNVLKSAGENDNVIISPLSISCALSMTLNGANGATRDSMLKTLRLNGITPDEINNSFMDLTKALLSVDKRVLITIANSVWTENNFAAKQAFTDLLKNYYSAAAESFDINDASTPDRINKWIEDNTNGLITKMIDKLDDNTVMLLINAIYFKGKWTSRFDASKTSELPFYRTDGISADVPMMKQESDFKAYKGQGFTFAEIPYGQGNYVMDIILPDASDGLNSLLLSFNDAAFTSWVAGLYSQKVDLSLPRFKYGFKKELNDILSDMGMGNAFQDGADFSNISDQYQLKISTVLHQAFIETNEEGTEAAAATVVGIVATSLPSILEINLDHPFLYIIRETSTNAILFMGRVSDPLQN